MTLYSYIIYSILGVGTFGQVRECVNKETKEEFAVKIIEQDSRGSSWGEKSMAWEEADLLGSLSTLFFHVCVYMVIS